MDPTLFRENFPEFADQVAYPTSTITFWATLAVAQVNQTLFGTIYTTILNLYVAHNLVMARQNAQSGRVGGSPGQSGGIANSKTIGQVTAAYDASTQTEKDAGWWNRTTYGQQYIRLVRLYGVGGIQL